MSRREFCCNNYHYKAQTQGNVVLQNVNIKKIHKNHIWIIINWQSYELDNNHQCDGSFFCALICKITFVYYNADESKNRFCHII